MGATQKEGEARGGTIARQVTDRTGTSRMSTASDIRHRRDELAPFARPAWRLVFIRPLMRGLLGRVMAPIGRARPLWCLLRAVIAADASAHRTYGARCRDAVLLTVVLAAPACERSGVHAERLESPRSSAMSPSSAVLLRERTAPQRVDGAQASGDGALGQSEAVRIGAPVTDSGVSESATRSIAQLLDSEDEFERCRGLERLVGNAPELEMHFDRVLELLHSSGYDSGAAARVLGTSEDLSRRAQRDLVVALTLRSFDTFFV